MTLTCVGVTPVGIDARGDGVRSLTAQALRQRREIGDWELGGTAHLASKLNEISPAARAPVSSANTSRDFAECLRREVCRYGTFTALKTSGMIAGGNGRNKYKRKCHVINE